MSQIALNQMTNGRFGFAFISAKSACQRCVILLTTLICIAVSSSLAMAQFMVLDYAAAIVGERTEVSRCLTFDDAGNLYVAGTFEGTVDFDPGEGVFNVSSTDDSDSFICKLNARGHFQWVKVLTGTGSALANRIIIDGLGDLIFAGSFSLTVDFDPGPGDFSLSTGHRSDTDVFVCKLGPDGDFLWAVQMRGPSYVDALHGLSLDGAGNIHVTGDFGRTADFDPGPGVFTLTSEGITDTFVCKLDTSGGFVWAVAFPGTTHVNGRGIAVDGEGSVYAAGYFVSSTDFDPGPNVFTLTTPSPIHPNSFICKLDRDGNFIWAGAFTGEEGNIATGVALDGAGGVYITGLLRGTADFDPGPGAVPVSSVGWDDIYVCKLHHSGAFQWTKTVSGDGEAYNYDIEVSEGGSIFISGTMTGTADFDPGAGTFNLSTGIRRWSSFVWKIDTAGNFEWAGLTRGGGDNFLFDLAVDRLGGVYGTGIFQGATDFDPGAGSSRLISTGEYYYDAFIMRLELQSLPVPGNDYGLTNADQALVLLTTPPKAATVLANDTDANTRYTLTVTAHDPTSTLGAAVLVNPDGTFVYDPTAVAVFQALAPGDSLEDSFTYTVSDGTDSAVGTVTITVYGAGTMLPALAAWGLGLLYVALAGAGVRAVKSCKASRI